MPSEPPPTPVSATRDAKNHLWRVVFDRPLLINPHLFNGNWLLRAEGWRWGVDYATAYDHTVTIHDNSALLPDPGSKAVSYLATPPDLLGTDMQAAPAFDWFPIP